MMVRKLIVIALLGIGVFIGSCKNNDELTISGKIENAGEIRKVLLYETDQIVDSAFLNESNEFKFRRVAPEANFFTIAIGEKNFLVVGQNGDELEFKSDYLDSTNTYEVSGSKDSEKIRDFNKINNDYGKIFQKIQSEYAALVSASPDSKDSIYNALMPKFQSNMDKFSEEGFKFVQDNKDNLAGFYAAGTIDQNKYEQQLIAYAEEVKSKFPKNKSVQSFVSKMIGLKAVSIGQIAPDFSLPDPNGKEFKLSDFREKYILLDFWASWCAPCREENPNIVKQFERFKDKNFTVLGVSLDDDRAGWLKAIKDDRLNWPHLSELKRWDGKVSLLYKVEGIPASFILDPSGKIIAKNLRGAELEQFLEKTLK
jgi:peroxiredoxin